MTDKEKLSQYWDMGKEMIDLEIKIEKLYDKEKFIDVVESSRKKFPFTKTSYKLESLELSDEKIFDTLGLNIDTLEKRYNNLLNLRAEVERIISNIPRSRLRRIFTYRYIDHNTWLKVAFKMDDGSTADSVRKEHDRYLKKQKNHKN